MFMWSSNPLPMFKRGGLHAFSGASSVHSSNSDGLIRDMPAIADLNITSVSKIQDKPEKPIKKKKRNSTNVTLQKLSQTLWMVAGHPQSLTTLSSNIYCQLFTVSTFGGFQWTRQIGGFTQVWWPFTQWLISGMHWAPFFAIQISKKHGKVLLLHWNCFLLHHLCLISFELLNASVCLPL